MFQNLGNEKYIYIIYNHGFPQKCARSCKVEKPIGYIEKFLSNKLFKGFEFWLHSDNGYPLLLGLVPGEALWSRYWRIHSYSII